MQFELSPQAVCNRRTLAAMAGVLAFCAMPALATEWRGQEVDASRLVSVGGSLTEIVYALGEEERLIARDSTSLHPPAALELPDVGYMRALSPEGVLSVEPTLIVALEGSGPPEAVEVLERASVPFVTVPERFDREGILEKIRIVGEVLGVEERAAELAAHVAADLTAAEAVTADIDERRKVLFVLSVQGGRLLASGFGTAADGIIAMAGGVNAVDGYRGYKQLTDEAVIEAAPDVILMMEQGGGTEALAGRLFDNAVLASTPAGLSRNLIVMDGAFLLGFGPRTAQAVRDLAQAFYGEEAAN